MNLEAKQVSATPGRTGYSPAIAAQLHVNGEQFRLAAIDDQRVVVRAPRKTPPGPAVIRMQVDDRESVYHIYLTKGIDPTQDDQPYTDV
jgi:hypothetical protein